MVKNKIIDELIKLNLIDIESLEIFHVGVRDNREINVIKCKKSGLVFLDKIEKKFYDKKTILESWGSTNRVEALKNTYNDDIRRFKQIENLIINKKYLDIGCGLGGIFEYTDKVSQCSHGVEPQDDINKMLNKNHKVFKDISEINEKYDIISLFHVYEHLIDPLNTLLKINKILNDNGKIIIEVPHANDALISLYNLKSFKDFTFWSEHLILHTKESLNKFLLESGFKNIQIHGYQRYPISNHVVWIRDGAPGGHNTYTEFNNEKLNNSYNNFLLESNMTDTLIAMASK